jgi:hypothetical protein
VGKRTTWLGIATSVTALDAAVVTYYGGTVWRAFAGHNLPYPSPPQQIRMWSASSVIAV